MDCRSPEAVKPQEVPGRPRAATGYPGRNGPDWPDGPVPDSQTWPYREAILGPRVWEGSCGMGQRDEGDEVERRFDAAMYEIYDRAGRELGYWATRYLQLLRNRGGLGAARYLLHQRATSDGYKTLRDAGRLDLTVEAYVLRDEFRLLFTPEELAKARERLEFYEEVAREEAPPGPPDEILEALLGEAADAPPDVRVELYRERVAAFGPRALAQIEAWEARGGPAGFAVAAIEEIGHRGNVGAAIRALGRVRARRPDWAGVIDAAIERLKALG